LERIETTVDDGAKGERLDRFLRTIRPDISRSEIQRQIRAGRVTLAGAVVKQPSSRLRGGEGLLWEIPEEPVLRPRSLPLDILFEDDEIVIVNKQAGLVVHPGSGTADATLVEGLLVDRDLPASDDPARPGIVHRLDKETSGIIVVAKTEPALSGLKAQFSSRRVDKSYIALADGGFVEEEGVIDAPIGRDHSRPSRMAVEPGGRPAQTEFRVLARYPDRSLLLVRPITGRTHQIRVHFSYIGHPIVGDRVYGSRRAERLFLHAWRIAFEHPKTKGEVRFEAPVPPKFPDYPYGELPWRDRAARR